MALSRKVFSAFDAGGECAAPKTPECIPGAKGHLSRTCAVCLNSCEKSARKIWRRLKPAPDKLNKRLIGTTEVVP